MDLHADSKSETTCVWVYIHICVSICQCMCVCMYTYICMCVCTCVCVRYDLPRDAHLLSLPSCLMSRNIINIHKTKTYKYT